MVDFEAAVCCMCGDVGFSDKIFRCIKCHNRFQHSYCSNYYSESSEPTELCDWCKTEEIRSATPRQHGGNSSRRSTGVAKIEAGRSEYSGDKMIKQQHDREDDRENKAKSPTGVPSPRTSTRRYKLLKDVMC